MASRADAVDLLHLLHLVEQQEARVVQEGVHIRTKDKDKGERAEVAGVSPPKATEAPPQATTTATTSVAAQQIVMARVHKTRQSEAGPAHRP